MDKITGYQSRGLGSLKEVNFGQLSRTGRGGKGIGPKIQSLFSSQLTFCPWARYIPSSVLQMRGEKGWVVFISTKTHIFPKLSLFRTQIYKPNKGGVTPIDQGWEPRAHPLRLDGLHGRQLEKHSRLSLRAPSRALTPTLSWLPGGGGSRNALQFMYHMFLKSL